MKTKTLKQNKVNVVTLGCSKNIYDSEVLMSQLKGNNFDVEHESEVDDASTVIINTCGFIDNAKQESIDTILNYAEAKTEGKVDKLYVTGCLSERYAKELEVDIPEVDAWFGTRDLPRLLKTMKADYKKELVGERLLTTPIHYAYLKIAEGCDRPCAFCAIPLMRGKHRSTPIETLVERAEELVKKGVKELILIAQDLTFYGLDIYKERRLADLLRKLSDIKGVEWIRLHYAFPAGFPMDVLDVMRERDNICNYIDIPLQHASTRMLKSMRRGITKEKTVALIESMREKVPGITIRTTLISGFPGESEVDFEEMKDWVRQVKFDRLGIFNYSHEEDTHAYQMEDDVPDEIKQSRADEIMEIQSEISAELNLAKEGEIYKVLFDRIEGGMMIGRTEADSPEVDNEVIVDVNDRSLIGQFANVKVTKANVFDLFGEIV